ncbi:MAG: 50S ribosomal protein L4, partial [Prolixibacteraceae bacterium]|nr:50S ribosomal protein L4 [Prolixibacteraceae bacterium]
KGTGTARAGMITSPTIVGGGRAFGPRPRNYSFKLNKKVKLLARKSALAHKALDQDIVVVENFNLDTPKTKMMAAISENLKISDKKSLFVLPEENKSIYLSSRNLQGVSVVTASELTTYQILNTKTLVILEGSVEIIEDVFKL